MSPPGSTRARWGEALALVLVIVALDARAFGAALSWELTDADAWADVAWAARPLSEQLLVPLTGGVAGDDANFWRPAAMLQFWVVRRLFGWSAAGWMAWNLVEHALATLLGAWMLRELLRVAKLPQRLIPALVAVAFVAFPLTEDVVPAVARSIDLLLAVGMFGALGSLALLAQGRRWAWLPYVVASVVALGAKESAVLLGPLVAAWVWLFRVDLPPRARVLELARLAAPVLLLTLAYLLLRRHVLGGLGGYWGDVKPEWVWSALQRGFIEPFVPSVGRWIPRSWLTGIVAASVWAVILRAAWRSSYRAVAAFGGLWFVATVLLYAATGTCSRRVFYVPTFGGLLVLAAAAVHGWRHPVGALLALGWLGTWLHGSPAVRRYEQWREIAAASELYRVPAFWEALPRGAHVWLAERPFRADLDLRTFQLWGGRSRSLHHGAPAYAVQAWLDEVMPEHRIVVSTLTGFAMRAPLAEQDVVVDVDGVSLVVRHDGADRQRWKNTSPFDLDDQGRTLRITPRKARPGLVIVVWTPRGPVAWTPGKRELVGP